MFNIFFLLIISPYIRPFLLNMAIELFNITSGPMIFKLLEQLRADENKENLIL